MSFLIISRKIRIYPNIEQLIIINNTFDVCRFIWNQSLELSIKSFDEGHLKIPCLGWVKYNPREKQIPDDWKIKHITISKSNIGKYYCSICFEYSIDIDNILKNKDKNINILGIDYSSSSLYVDSEGNKANYPKYYRSNLDRFRILQKKFSRQQKGSKNRDRTLNKIRILHEKISSQRRDFLHKLSTSITKKFDVICVEDINMQNMSKGLRLGKSTYDNGFGMFRTMLSYKQDRIPYHELILANKWFPSSKRCSKCGNIKSDLKLKDRIYKCNECGLTIDRDLNAAINLKQYAFSYINGLNILC